MYFLYKTKIIILSVIFTILFQHIVFAKALDEFNEKKYNSSFRSAFTESMSGKPEAFYVLGKLYLFGLGDIKKNQNKALENLNKAIKNKYAPAAIFLAKEFKNGKYLKKNYSEARRLFIVAQNLGGGDFSKMIASISQEMSDDDLTTTSCLDAKAASEKNARSFYLYYARCMIKEEGVKKDINLVKKYIEKIKTNPQQEEIISLVKILTSGPDEIKDSAEAYNLISNYIKENKPSDEFKEKLIEAQNQIKFDIADCENLVKNRNIKTSQLVCSKIENSNESGVLIKLSKIYKKNKSIFLNFDENNKNILKKAIVLNNVEALNMLDAIYKERDETIPFLKYLNSSINDKSISSNIKKSLKSTIDNVNDNLINKYKQDDQLKKIVFQSISENNCNLLDKFIESADLKLIKESVSKVNVSQINCNNSLGLDLLSAIDSLNKSNIEDAFNSYKKLCSLGVKNSCVFLGNMYIDNNLPSSMNSFDKTDRVSFALKSYSKSVDRGNLEAMLLFADLSLENNINKEKANSLLDKAIARGQIDGLYIKSKHKFRDFFSNSAACKDLKSFLNNNPTRSLYFEKAIKLNKKKCN